MNPRSARLAVILFSFFLLLRTHADPAGELASFSAFKNVDLAKLAKGEVLSARGPQMSFPRGLEVESCYLVFAPVQKTAELHRQWNPARHPELKVYLHVDLPSKPSPADFGKIGAAPENSAVRSLISATQKLNPERPELFLSASEASTIVKSAGSRSSNGAVLSGWGGVLSERARAFANGGVSKEPPYNYRGETIRVSDDIARLLKEQPKIRAQFPALADAALSAPSKAALYWELFNVEGQAAFSLGAYFDRPAPEKWQALDLQYYASNGYFALLTFYQGWPVNVDGQQATLVWRGDLLSSPSLAELHGVERVGSGAAMMKEIQKSIRVLLKEAPSGR